MSKCRIGLSSFFSFSLSPPFPMKINPFAFVRCAFVHFVDFFFAEFKKYATFLRKSMLYGFCFFSRSSRSVIHSFIRMPSNKVYLLFCAVCVFLSLSPHLLLVLYQSIVYFYFPLCFPYENKRKAMNKSTNNISKTERKKQRTKKIKRYRERAKMNDRIESNRVRKEFLKENVSDSSGGGVDGISKFESIQSIIAILFCVFHFEVFSFGHYRAMLFLR